MTDPVTPGGEIRVAAVRYCSPENDLEGVNIAGSVKVVDAMLDQRLV